jgi:hypothetical protein
VEPFLGVANNNLHSIVHHGGGVHGKHTSHKKSHMNDKIDVGFRIREGEESDGDLM